MNNNENEQDRLTDPARKEGFYEFSLLSFLVFVFSDMLCKLNRESGRRDHQA